MVLEVLELGFVQRAIIAAAAVAITSSVIGLFLVLRRNSLFGDALSHVAFGGIAVGIVTNTYPLWTGLALSIAGALGMTKLRESAKIPPDAAVALLLSSGLAFGLLLISIQGGLSSNLFSFLLGSIFLVSVEDTVAILALAGIILATVILLYRQLVYVTFDEEQARVSGLQVSRLNYLFIVLASVAVLVSMRLVGILLVSSLIVIPNLTALSFGRGFKKTALISVCVSLACVMSGMAISYAFNIAPSATVVLVSVAVYLAAFAAKRISATQGRKTEEQIKS